MIDPKYALVVRDALTGCAAEPHTAFSLSSWLLEGVRIIDGQMRELEQLKAPPHMSDGDAIKELRSMVSSQARALAEKENELRGLSDRFDESLADLRRSRVRLQTENESLTKEREVMLLNAKDYRATINKLTAARDSMYSQLDIALRDGEIRGMRKIQEEHTPHLAQAIELTRQAAKILDTLKLSTNGTATKAINADAEEPRAFGAADLAARVATCSCYRCVNERTGL